MSDGSEALHQLRPVTFRYKQAYEDGQKPIQYGLIAEEVAEVFPELAVYNEDGQPETVKYQLLSSLLLNEFLKLCDDHDALKTEKDIEILALQEANAALQNRVALLEGLATRLASIEKQLGVPAAVGEEK